MSMIRAQEYFAPLRSRHISLQQWERGLLFESWGSRGGRGDQQNSGDFKKRLSASDPEETEYRRPGVKKVIARSVSFSPSLGREVSSELKVTKNFARGLSFPRSLVSHEEIIPEELDFCCPSRRLNADHAHIFSAQTSTAFLFPRSLEGSLESGQIESSETSSSSFQDSEDSLDLSDHPPADTASRPWPRKFFSGGLSLSRDRKFFSGVLSFSKDKKFFSGSLSLPKRCATPCGKSLDRSQRWGVNENFSTNLKNPAVASSAESRLKSRFLGRVLTFSRSLDPRGEISKSNKGTENDQESKFPGFRRGLSFSRSLDPNGESKDSFTTRLSFSRSLDANGENKYFRSGRDLSFSRSLDPDGELLASEDCSINSGSPKPSRAPEQSWSKKFISRSGLFFSKTLSPSKRPRETTPSDTSSEKDTTEARSSKKRFGQRFSFSFSRFLDPFVDSRGDSSSVPISGSSSGINNGPGKIEKESPFKRFFIRGPFRFPNSKSGETIHQPSTDASCGKTEPLGNGGKPQSKSRFFSKDWSWSRNKNRSTVSPAKSSSQLTLANSNNSRGTEEIQECESDTTSFPSSRHSQALKNWWSKRCQTSGISTRSAQGNDQNSRLVLLDKVPESGDHGSDDLTVYVGERGGSLTKYVLAKKILRHHLFQVLLKCSQDELGSDHDYNSGVPIICDPALFLQVARAVGGNFSSETRLCT